MQDCWFQEAFQQVVFFEVREPKMLLTAGLRVQSLGALKGGRLGSGEKKTQEVEDALLEKARSLGSFGL